MFDLPPPKDDGMYMPKPVGKWSRQKHYFLLRYIDAFTTSMKDKAWSGLHYIDLFAGAGIVRVRDSDELAWGSPLIAAQAPHPFDGLHFCESSRRRAQTLQTRLDRIRPKSQVQVLRGDANQKVCEVMGAIPQRALSLAFLDPYGLHLHYKTLQILSRRRVDLIIFFPDHLDALRNSKYVYQDTPDSNLDRVLGPDADWRKALEAAPPHRWAEVLRDLYRQQIGRLGYEHFEFERIRARGHPLYLLIFCSKHSVGAKLWCEVSQKKRDGQRELPFPTQD